MTPKQNSPQSSPPAEEADRRGEVAERRAWLDNPANLKRFFERVERASQDARMRERRPSAHSNIDAQMLARADTKAR